MSEQKPEAVGHEGNTVLTEADQEETVSTPSTTAYTGCMPICSPVADTVTSSTDKTHPRQVIREHNTRLSG